MQTGESRILKRMPLKQVTLALRFRCDYSTILYWTPGRVTIWLSAISNHFSIAESQAGSAGPAALTDVNSGGKSIPRSAAAAEASAYHRLLGRGRDRAERRIIDLRGQVVGNAGRASGPG